MNGFLNDESQQDPGQFYCITKAIFLAAAYSYSLTVKQGTSSGVTGNYDGFFPYPTLLTPNLKKKKMVVRM